MKNTKRCPIMQLTKIIVRVPDNQNRPCQRLKYLYFRPLQLQ